MQNLMQISVLGIVVYSRVLAAQSNPLFFYLILIGIFNVLPGLIVRTVLSRSLY